MIVTVEVFLKVFPLKKECLVVVLPTEKAWKQSKSQKETSSHRKTQFGSKKLILMVQQVRCMRDKVLDNAH